MRHPTIKDLAALCKSIKAQICDDYLAFPEDDEPGIQLTVGANEQGEWGWQSGDNCFHGAAYFYPHWGVVGVYRRSNCRELAREIKDQIEEQIEEQIYG